MENIINAIPIPRTQGELLYYGGFALLGFTVLLALIFLIRRPKYRPEQAASAQSTAPLTHRTTTAPAGATEIISGATELITEPMNGGETELLTQPIHAGDTEILSGETELLSGETELLGGETELLEQN